MAEYKLYCLDGLQKVSRPPIVFDAPDDETAQSKTEVLREGAQCELWHGLRLVARIPKPISCRGSFEWEAVMAGMGGKRTR